MARTGKFAKDNGTVAVVIFIQQNGETWRKTVTYDTDAHGAKMWPPLETKYSRGGPKVSDLERARLNRMDRLSRFIAQVRGY